MSHLLAGGAAIILVLAARVVSVGIPLLILERFRSFSKGAFPILVWGGLRGGISVALALSLPEGEIKSILLSVTYVVVIFSVVVQGSTVAKAAKRFTGGT